MTAPDGALPDAPPDRLSPDSADAPVQDALVPVDVAADAPPPDGPPAPPVTVQWVRRAGGVADDRPFSVAIAADGSFFTAGSFEYMATFGPGEERATQLVVGPGASSGFLAAHASDGALRWAVRLPNGHRLAPFPEGGVLTVHVLTFTRYAADGTSIWVKTMGGDPFGKVDGLRATADGGFVAAGQFYRTVVFGPGETNATTFTATGQDGFVARFAGDGSLVWARAIAGTGSEQAQDVAVLPDGEVVVVGRFAGTATFAGPGRSFSLSAEDPGDGFIARYDTGGNPVWVRQVTGAGQQDVHASVAFPNGDFAIAGHVHGRNGPSVFGPGEPTETTFQSNRVDFEFYLARYGGEGRLRWAKLALGSYNARDQTSLLVTADGGIALAAGFGFTGTGVTVFGAGEPNETTLFAGSGNPDIALVQYNADGSLRRARAITGGPGVAVPMAAAPAGVDGMLLVGGFGGEVTFGVGAPTAVTHAAGGNGLDIFLMRLDL